MSLHTTFSSFLTSSAFFLFSAPSLRLAYKDLEQQRKLEEQKLKGLEGKKKEQAERLGMGLGIRRYSDEQINTSGPVSGSISFLPDWHFCFVSALICSGVSHSVTSDMHIIQQENPSGAKTTKPRRFTDDDDDEACFSSRSNNDRKRELRM